jgi:hypothetical protein
MSIAVPESLQPILKAMLTPNVTERPEVEELMRRPETMSHINRRKRMLRVASLKNHFSAIVRFWNTIVSFIMSLVLFKVKKNVNMTRIEIDRSTPEPFPMDRDVPSILVNENSFSDGNSSIHYYIISGKI